MNWAALCQHGHVSTGDTLLFVGQKRDVEATILKDFSVEFENVVYSRPSQLWSALFGNESRKKSWWDSCFYKSKQLQQLRHQDKKRLTCMHAHVSNIRSFTSIHLRRSCRRNPALPKATPSPTAMSEPPPKAKRARRKQLSIRHVGRPRKLTPKHFDVIDKVVALTRCDFVRKFFGKHVLSFLEDDSGFICKCGGEVSLANSNYKKNVENHFKLNEKCKKLRKRRLQNVAITSFFKPVQTFARPDPRVYCLGLWNEQVQIDGVDCKTSYLGEYACVRLFYICNRRFTVKARTGGDEHTVTRTIYSADCLGHCLDNHDRLRSSRTCLKCCDLLKSADFKRMLIDAQDPRRKDPSCKLSNSYYSWKQLVIQKRAARERAVQNRWSISNAKRAHKRRMQAHLKQAQTATKTGDLRQVVKNLRMIRKHGDAQTATTLFDFITTFARKGAQQARVHKGEIKSANGGSWGIVKQVFTGLKVMDLPRANKLILSTLGSAPSVACVKKNASHIARKQV